jgi:hypothetical protein
MQTAITLADFVWSDSPEFAEMQSTPAILEKLREITGGQAYQDNAESLARAADPKEGVFRPVATAHANLQALWPWFVVLTAVCLLFDVAIRHCPQAPLLLMSYLNPYAVLGYFTHAAKLSIQNDRELDFCDVVDALSEMASKSVQQSGTALPLEVLGKMQEIMRDHGSIAKAISAGDVATAKFRVRDHLSRSLAFSPALPSSL